MESLRKRAAVCTTVSTWLSLEDFHAYLTALGYDMKIVIGKRDQTAFDEVKHHALSIKRLLDHSPTSPATTKA